MNGWTTITLGQMADFRNGLNYSSADRGEGLAVVGVTNFQNNSFVDFKQLEELSPSALSTQDALIQKHDILFVRSNGNRELIGRSLLVPSDPPKPTSHSGFTIRLRFTDARANPKFYAYLLRGGAVRSHLSSHGGGTSINNLNQGILSRLIVPVPPLETQRRIASILGAYDNLIEVNRRRVAILEEMARGLFYEWFVRFRFPGYENVPMVETPEGLLPEGWTSTSIGAATAYVNRGIAPKYADDAPTLVIGQKCIRDQKLSLNLARRQAKRVPADKVVRAGDVLINSTGVGTLGRVAQAEEVPPGITVDSHVTIVRPIGPADRDFLGLFMMRMQPIFEALGAGSTGQTELSRTSVQNQVIVWPSVALRMRFGVVIRPMRALAAQLSKQNTSLAVSRDLLLPRLISGQLSVEAAERELEEAA